EMQAVDEMFVLVPPLFCACIEICCDAVLIATACGSLVKTKFATCACTAQGMKRSTANSNDATPRMRALSPLCQRPRTALWKSFFASQNTLELFARNFVALFIALR